MLYTVKLCVQSKAKQNKASLSLTAIAFTSKRKVQEGMRKVRTFAKPRSRRGIKNNHQVSQI